MFNDSFLVVSMLLEACIMYFFLRLERFIHLFLVLVCLLFECLSYFCLMLLSSSVRQLLKTLFCWCISLICCCLIPVCSEVIVWPPIYWPDVTTFV